MAEEVLTGGCQCGKVRYTARGRPKRAGLCHCLTCRRNTGSAFLAYLVYPRAKVEIAGATRHFRAPLLLRHFCPECGSPLFLEAEGTDEFDVYVGSLDEAARAPGPSYELFTARRLAWLPPFPGLRKSFPGNRPADFEG